MDLNVKSIITIYIVCLSSLQVREINLWGCTFLMGRGNIEEIISFRVYSGDIGRMLQRNILEGDTYLVQIINCVN